MGLGIEEFIVNDKQYDFMKCKISGFECRDQDPVQEVRSRILLWLWKKQRAARKEKEKKKGACSAIYIYPGVNNL